jgi:sarcosine oxidase
MKSTYDVIIVGTGAMGSATAAELSRRGRKVLCFDRFEPPHNLGSSHGQTRIIREAYYENPKYVPIIQKAYENWEKLERDSGESLYLRTGGLIIGPGESQLQKGAVLSAEMHHLPHEILDSGQIRKRFPAFHPDSDDIGIWEPRAGILFPEKCIEANLRIASKHGAMFHFNETVTDWEASNGSITVNSSLGKYHADRLLLTAGAWLGQLLAGLQISLKVERQVLYWFGAKSNTRFFQPENFPIFIWSYDHDRIFYGFPDLGSGIKFAKHYDGEPAHPDTIDRVAGRKEIESMKALIRRWIPDAEGQLLSTSVCMYTNTPNLHFYISPHHLHEQVLIASICSGHGFKFASAFGEILSDILEGKKPDFDLSLFGFSDSLLE